MAIKIGRLIRTNRGNAVVEMALVLPLLLFLCFGITEFGRAWMTMSVLTSAAREGARLAVVTAPDVALVTQRINQLCSAARVVPSNITVDGPDPANPNRTVTVTVETQFPIVVGRVLELFGGNRTGTIPLRATTVMRHEGV